MSNTIKIQHDEQREKDVQALVDAILKTSPKYWDNPNGAYESECPFCGDEIHRGGGDHIWARMHEFKHEPNCAWLIAKDLKTNL